jgi:hypothetical protein
MELERKKDHAKHWLCKYCYEGSPSKIKAMASDSTSSCSNHLGSDHSIYQPGKGPAPANTATIMNTYLEDVAPLAAEKWREHFINWITHDDITFEQAASPWLRKVIINGGPHVIHLLPCATTVRTWIMNTYYERVADVKKSLVMSRSKINLSFDAWSSPNHRSLLGIVAHWIDEKRTLKTALLGLRPLDGHTGSDIADALIPVMKLFDIGGEKIGAFQMDNATSNDTAMSALAARIPGIDVKESRLRCFGHVVNLVVKALLYGSKSSTLQQELGAAAGDDEAAFKIWREQGSIGRLHNLVTYISRSDSRRRAFETAQKVDASLFTLQLVRDLGVRWNSTFAMIKRALELQKALQRYCMQWEPAVGESHDLTKDFLDPQDWVELEHFHDLLKPFNNATKRAEGNATLGSHGALWEVIPTIEYLFKILKKRADEVTAKPHRYTDYYSTCINHGFVKLQQYYRKLDDSRLYCAATALNPCRRFTYFEREWANKPGGRKEIANTRR